VKGVALIDARDFNVASKEVVNDDMVDRILLKARLVLKQLSKGDARYYLETTRDHYINEVNLRPKVTTNQLRMAVFNLELSLQKFNDRLGGANETQHPMLDALELASWDITGRRGAGPECISDLRSRTHELRDAILQFNARYDEFHSLSPSEQGEWYLAGGVRRELYCMFINRSRLTPERSIIENFLPPCYVLFFGEEFTYSRTQDDCYGGPAIRFAEATLRELGIWDNSWTPPRPFEPKKIGNIWHNHLKRGAGSKSGVGRLHCVDTCE
jgi:hypothetical protein